MTKISGCEEDVNILRQHLIGRSVVAVHKFGDQERLEGAPEAEGEVVLDNGTRLLLGGNQGCGGCSSGWYELSKLNDIPVNGITNVEIVKFQASNSQYADEGDQVYSIFVLGFEDNLNLAELARFDGSDGNGYYGTGFWFTILSFGEEL